MSITSAGANGLTSPERIQDPIFALIEAHRPAWARFVEADYSKELACERGERLRIADEILDKLLQTKPTTLAGVQAVIAFFVEWDTGSLPETSGSYLPTLLRSPVFAGIDDKDTARVLAQYERDGRV